MPINFNEWIQHVKYLKDDYAMENLHVDCYHRENHAKLISVVR